LVTNLGHTLALAMLQLPARSIVAQYWTTGSHDGVPVLNAPSDEVAASLLLALAAEGNVRTTMLRAFDWAEAKELIAGD